MFREFVALAALTVAAGLLGAVLQSGAAPASAQTSSSAVPAQIAAAATADALDDDSAGWS